MGIGWSDLIFIESWEALQRLNEAYEIEVLKYRSTYHLKTLLLCGLDQRHLDTSMENKYQVYLPVLPSCLLTDQSSHTHLKWLAVLLIAQEVPGSFPYASGLLVGRVRFRLL